MPDDGTQTVRSRPQARASDVPPTISTTQEVPPPPPGWWARLWSRIRVSRHTRPVLILVPLAAILVAGIVSGRDGDGGSPLPAPSEEPPPAPVAEVSPDVIESWQTTADPVLADIERETGRVVAAVGAGEPALAVLHCRDSAELVAGWSPALVPAPDADLDAELRAGLDLLGRAFDTCSTASLDSVGSAMETLEDAGTHFTRAQVRLSELTG